jgi:ABC-type transporter Mla subunit MlaD
MDVEGILDQLRLEREQIEEAILSLERLASGQEKRRGRPPKWMAEAKKRAGAQAKKTESLGRTAIA